MNRFGASGCTELAEDRGQVELHGVLADAKRPRNVAIGKTVSDQRQHVVFSSGQRFNQTAVVLGHPSGWQRHDGLRQLRAIDELQIRVREEPAAKRVELVRRAAMQKTS